MGSGPVAIATSPVPNAPRGHSRVNRMRDVMTNPDLQLMADEFAIRRVLDEYCLRLEVNAFDEWLDLFTDDTEYHVFRRVLKGRNELSAMLSLAPHGVHVPGAARIDISGDTAEVIQSYLFVPSTDSKWNAGWYRRTLVRTAAGWKIAVTKVKIGRIAELADEGRQDKLVYPVHFD